MHGVPATKKSMSPGRANACLFFFSSPKCMPRGEGISNLFFTMRFRKGQLTAPEKREHLDYRIQCLNSAATNQTEEITLTNR